jgi:hypothetical protein
MMDRLFYDDEHEAIRAAVEGGKGYKATAAYANYGGRGITVCERWQDFDLFVEDMGLSLDGLQIDRIDNNGPYAKWNCRWVSAKENMRNSRMAKPVTLDGETKIVSDWVKHFNVDPLLFQGLRGTFEKHGTPRDVAREKALVVLKDLLPLMRQAGMA